MGRNKYRYDVVAVRAECGAIACEVVETRPLITINDLGRQNNEYHQVPMNGRRPGIVTTYCLNPGSAWRCPDWVDESVNAQPASRGAKKDLTVLTYEPLTDVHLRELAETGRVVAGAMVL